MYFVGLFVSFQYFIYKFIPSFAYVCINFYSQILTEMSVVCFVVLFKAPNLVINSQIQQEQGPKPITFNTL